MNVTELFTRWDFLLNGAVVAVVMQGLKLAATNYFPKDEAAQRRAKVALTCLSLILGAIGGALLQYTPSLGQNILIGVIAGAFSTQAYMIVKRYLPEGWAGQPKSEEGTPEPTPADVAKKPPEEAP